MDLTKKSKWLSLILRHDPAKGNVSMDDYGWVSVNDLIQNAGFTISELEQIVSTDNKSRYEFTESYTNKKIRAVQGHSIPVIVDLIETEPLHSLYHGTKTAYVESIMVTGLEKRKRLYVHLSKDIETATIVGKRRIGEMAMLEIDAVKMHEDGYKFFLAKNGVWLIDHVPSQYIKITF